MPSFSDWTGKRVCGGRVHVRLFSIQSRQRAWWFELYAYWIVCCCVYNCLGKHIIVCVAKLAKRSFLWNPGHNESLTQINLSSPLSYCNDLSPNPPCVSIVKKKILNASSSEPSSANTVLNEKLRLINIGRYFVFTFCMERLPVRVILQLWNHTFQPRVSVLFVNRVINMLLLEWNSQPNGQMKCLVSLKVAPQEVEKEKEAGK